MSISNPLIERSEGQCELCGATEDLNEYNVPPTHGADVSERVVICNLCKSQFEATDYPDANHWLCLNDAVWSQVPAVQVMANVMLHKLSNEGWAQDLLGMMYMDEETTKWVNVLNDSIANKVVHMDSNGNVLNAGDTVVLLKDLNVKGGGFTAKRGTSVRKITLVENNPEQIEGRVNDQHIVILTQYVRKSS